MFGHGRPSSLAFALARTALALCAVLANSAWGQVITPVTAPTNESSGAVQIAAASEPVRLRISWGGGEARAWVGEVRLDKGSLSNLKPLGTDPDAAGSVWVEGGRLRIGALSPHKSDRVEIAAESVPNAQLLIELAGDTKVAPVKAQVALDELTRRPLQLRLDDQGNTLEITLIPTPILQISIKGDPQSRDSLVFAPGQQLSFEMALQLPNALHGTTLDLQTTLSPAPKGCAVD